jgi:P-type Cu2+ transporter
MHSPHAHTDHRPSATPGHTASGGHPANDARRAHDQAAHDTHARHSVAMFRDRFWWTLILTVPTLVWGHMLQSALGYAAPAFAGSRVLPAVFGTAVFIYGGTPFLQGGLRELRTRLPGMLTLISLAISVAFLFSAAVFLGFPGMPLWEELATLVTIMVLGHWMEMRAISQAQGALGELAKLLPSMAVKVDGPSAAERLTDVPVEQLVDGDLVLIRPGAQIPADGIVRTGHSSVNEALLTGESGAVSKAAGARVIAGAVNGSGSLRVEVTGTGERTALAGIMRSRRAPVRRPSPTARPFASRGSRSVRAPSRSWRGSRQVLPSPRRWSAWSPCS